MEKTIHTPRLKLTLIESAERGSPELKWLHELRSDEKTTWWSVHGQSKSLDDTENHLTNTILPNPQDPNAYRIAYAVHESANETEHFIGLITLRSHASGTLPGAAHLFPPSTRDFSPSSSVLTLELGYLFLPAAWGRGFAVEANTAVLSACRKVPWQGHEKVYVQAIVDDGNKASLRVAEKSGLERLGMYRWKGEAVWMGGEWRGEMDLWMWGVWII